MLSEQMVFDEETWAQLSGFIEKLPERVKLVVWGFDHQTDQERAAIRLGEALAERFAIIGFENRPRRANYDFWPVIGVMGEDEAGEQVDFRVRFIGHPTGVQINALVGAIQAVSFRASNLEARTRIQLSRLEERVDLEIFTGPDNEAGVPVATLAAGLAVASRKVRTFIIMAGDFPQAVLRYSVRNLPHTVINGRHHIEGTYDEAEILKYIARAIK